MRGLKNILTSATVVAMSSVSSCSVVLFSPDIAYSQMTGGTTRYSNQNPNFNPGPGYTPQQQEQIINNFRKNIPYGQVINPAIDVGRWAAEQQQKNGHPTSVGTTIQNNNYNKRR